MLSSIALHAGELLAAGLLAGAVFAALVAAGGLWLRRRVRRRLQALGPVLAGRARGAAAVAGAGLDPAVSEVSGLLSAAGQIQAAASAALASVSRPAARQLADDVRIEVTALAAGLASAAGTEGPPRSAETR